MTARTQLVVLYHDHQHMYFPVGPETGWRIDSASRCIVVGKFPRTYIPLDTVRSFEIEAVGGDAPKAVDEFDGPAGALESMRARAMTALAGARLAEDDARRDGRTDDVQRYSDSVEFYDWVLQRIDEEAAR